MTAAPTDDLACQELVEIITEYLEGALQPEDTARLEAHLRARPACDSVLAQFRETIRLVGRLREEEVRALDESVRRPLVDAFRAWAAERGGSTA